MRGRAEHKSRDYLLSRFILIPPTHRSEISSLMVLFTPARTNPSSGDKLHPGAVVGIEEKPNDPSQLLVAHCTGNLLVYGLREKKPAMFYGQDKREVCVCVRSVKGAARMLLCGWLACRRP